MGETFPLDYSAFEYSSSLRNYIFLGGNTVDFSPKKNRSQATLDTLKRLVIDRQVKGVSTQYFNLNIQYFCESNFLSSFI
jgi:hypothetical protein